MQCCKYKKYTEFDIEFADLDLPKTNCIICLNELGKRGY
jgi:hypothetical protein